MHGRVNMDGLVCGSIFECIDKIGRRMIEWMFQYMGG